MPHRSSRRPGIGVDLRALVPTPTGIGVYTLSLLRELAKRDRFDWVGMAHERPHHVDDLEACGVKVEVHPSLSGVVWQQTRAPRRLAAGDLDLFWSPILTLPLHLPVPAVTTVHDLTPLLHPETHRLKVRLSILPFLARSLARAAAVVADSESTAVDLRRYFPDCADRLHVIHPGVGGEFRPGEPEEMRRTRAELDCERGFFLYAGTLEPRKNLDLLLDAWEAARGAAPETLPLILCGPAGWAPKSFFQRIERLGPHVRWLGRLPRARLVQLMQAAAWFVYPSLYEGFGLPVAEAMACGVPPIVSDASSLPEIVGAAGRTFDPSSADELAEFLATARLASAERSTAAAEALERVRRFTWTAAAERLESLFAELLPAGTATRRTGPSGR